RLLLPRHVLARTQRQGRARGLRSAARRVHGGGRRRLRHDVARFQPPGAGLRAGPRSDQTEEDAMHAHRSMLALAWLLLWPAFAAAQDLPRVVSAEEARRYAGATVTVCDSVASATFAARSRGQPTFINLARPYPNQVFTIVIW